MHRPTARIDKILTQIKKNPLVVSLIAVSSLVIGISTFTDATKNLWHLMPDRAQPDIRGEWMAEVIYDWPDATYTEAFTFQVEGRDVLGTASFLGAKRGVLDGKLEGNKLTFDTITQEVEGDLAAKDSIHHYRGSIAGKEIKFVMQTVGGYSEHVPVEFTARRVAAKSRNSH